MLIIFDWDGTLIDSTAKIVRCMQQAAIETGVEVLSAESIRQIIGLGLPEAIATLYPHAEQPVLQQVREQYVHHFIELDQTPSPCFAGAHSLLQTLHRGGHYLAIATGKSRRGLDRALAQSGLGEFFHASRCADETRSKPHPQMLEELLQQFATAASAAVMVGDTHYDMAMAQALGMPRVAVSYGAHRREQLLPYAPLACLDQLAELPSVLSIN